MLLWRYMAYVNQAGRPEVQTAVDRLSVQATIRFAAAARWLTVMPIQDWHEPKAKKLKGFKELYEIRFLADGIQHRPLGFFGPAGGQFTVVLIAQHKQNVYKPTSAFETASRRIKEIQDGRATITPLQIDGEEF